MPGVIGYNLRDAINMLESAGVDVSFRGSGYVVSQSIAPGASFKPGQRVMLTLAQ